MVNGNKLAWAIITEEERPGVSKLKVRLVAVMRRTGHLARLRRTPWHSKWFDDAESSLMTRCECYLHCHTTRQSRKIHAYGGSGGKPFT
jgi:hypothetical protein